MKFILEIAIKQLLNRKRQSLVSFLGIVLGVAFFLAVSSLMKGSENDFIARLVNNSPHITVSDEYRVPRIQPVSKMYGENALAVVYNTRPLTERRGIRNFQKLVAYLNGKEGVLASPSLTGQGIISFAGKEVAVTLNGMIPEDISKITTIGNYIIEGSIDDLFSNLRGVVIGVELSKVLAISLGDNISVVSPTGRVEILKVVGIFSSGRNSLDRSQVYVPLKTVQSFLNNPFRANTVLVKMADPHMAREFAAHVESIAGYKSVSWQESSEDLMSTIKIRNRIMYTVVSAVLVVAAFGVYNVISTVVMEKYRDIAILKSMGFLPRDIQSIFAVQGIILGTCGCFFGLPLGMLFMNLLSQIKMKIPGSSQMVPMPIDWGLHQFIIAACFAMFSAILASYFPARKAGNVEPVAILRGGAW